MTLSLVQMKAGQSGTILSVGRGRGLERKLYSLGLHPGKKITKISSVFHGGPVIVQVDRTQLAVGYGKALRVLVEVDDVR